MNETRPTRSKISHCKPLSPPKKKEKKLEWNFFLASNVDAIENWNALRICEWAWKRSLVESYEILPKSWVVEAL